MECPRCGSESEPTGKEWKFSLFDVKGYECKGCNKKFQAHYRDNKLSHTVPRPS